MANTQVKGKIINAKTSGGYKGLTVMAVDFDPAFNEDDALGKTETNESGEFELNYTEDQYKFWMGDRNPDIVVRILNANGRLLHETKEFKNVTQQVLQIDDITIHPASVTGWLVNHATLNPANPDPIRLTKGNKLKHLIDGEMMFPEVTRAAKAATSSINLMQLFFDVGNGLITEFKDKPAFDPFQPPTSDCEESKVSTLEEVLKNAEIPVNVMVTNIPFVLGDTVTAVDKYYKDTRVKTAFFQHGFAVLHSKAIIFDGIKAILMGSPLKQYYFSGPTHAIHDARHKGSLNHDVNIQIEGPAVGHISKTFATVWKSTQKPLSLVSPPTIAEFTGGDSSDVASVQILRTLPSVDYRPTDPGDESLPFGETGILEGYQRAIANAERFIYIENQYFTSPEIIHALSFRMKDKTKPLEIILVLNFKPDLPGYPDRQVDNVNVLKGLAKANNHKLGVYTRWTRSILPDHDDFSFMPVYTHSKMAIIDDTWATVGSANLDGTSMNYHEIGLMATGKLGDYLLSKIKPHDDFGHFVFDLWVSGVYFVLKSIVLEFSILVDIILAIIGIAIALIFKWDEVVKFLKSTYRDIAEVFKDFDEVGRILAEITTRTAEHALPNREHQPSRSIEMNVAILNGIEGQPKTDTIRQLRQLLWKEHLGLEVLPDNAVNSPGAAPLNWVELWDSQAAKFEDAAREGGFLLPTDNPSILKWTGDVEAKAYLKGLKIKTTRLRDKGDVFQFDKCKFDYSKPFLPWPII